MKFLFVVLLAIAAVTANEQVCKPHTQFKKYCNTCACAPDGSSFACTRMMCNPEIWNEDGTLRIVPGSERVARSVEEKVCEPRTRFKKFCNTCACSIDGSSFACTRKRCHPEIWNEDGTRKIVTGSERVERSANGQVCEPHSQFKKYCNTCACSADGSSFACTRMMCDHEIWNEDGTSRIVSGSDRVARSAEEKVCEPRTQFKKFCNTCTCSIDGSRFACTKRMCDPEIWNEDGTLRITLESERVARSAKGQICEPRTQFKKYCNTCTCSIDGLSSACTMMMCNHEIWNEDGTRKIVTGSKRVERSVNGQVCEPHSQFKKYCNTCACSADGSSFACTRMMCDHEIWNEDGTSRIVPEKLIE